VGIFVKDGNGNVLRFIQACLSGLQTLNNTFASFTSNTREDLKYNAQIIYFTKRLNDLHDNELRRIYIVNTASTSVQYVSRTIEGITPVYVSRISEGITSVYVSRINDSGSDFNYIIKIPTGLIYSEDNFKATILRYNLADKRYTINTY